MSCAPALTADRLREVLDYDRATGLFRWKIARGSRSIGDIAGSPHPRGYIVIRVDGIRYLAHRLAWLLVTGEWPKNQVDHENLCRSENWWDNLREATQTQNNANTGLRSHNTSGFKGVFWNKQRNRWAAAIYVNKKAIHLGLFDDPAVAGAAYEAAAKAHYHEFARAA